VLVCRNHFEADLDDPDASLTVSDEHVKVAFCALESIELPDAYRKLVSRSR
jgi:hypothetical protein